MDSKENDVLEFVKRYKQEHAGNSPSFDEIATACGFSSRSTVRYHLQNLEKAGMLKFDGVRNIEIPGGRYVMEA